MKDQTPITELERAIIAKLVTARFPPATASKRFVNDLSSGHIKMLSDHGRAFLAFVAHRFRRQYQLTQEEWEWIIIHSRTPVTVRLEGTILRASQ